MQRKWFYFSPFYIFIFGCSFSDSAYKITRLPVNQQALRQITDYSISGQVSYVGPENRKSMWMYFLKEGNTTTLRLVSLFGQTLAKVRIYPDISILDSYEGKRLKSEDPSRLIERMIGLAVPIKEMENWLLGLPNQAEHCSFNEDHTLASTGGVSILPTWSVTYRSYEKIRAREYTLLLPHELLLNKGRHNIHLVIFRWRIEL